MLDGGGARGGCFHDTFGPKQTGMGRIIKAKELRAKSLTVGAALQGRRCAAAVSGKPWRFTFEPPARDEARFARRRAKSRRDSARDESR